MILIGGLKEYTNDSAVCWLDITENSAFFQPENQGVPAYIGIEYMAQSIAAFAGANALENGEEIKVGFLLGSRKYEQSQNYFPSGSHLEVNIVELHKEDSGLGVYSCKITCEDKVVANAQVNVFLPEDTQAFVKE